MSTNLRSVIKLSSHNRIQAYILAGSLGLFVSSANAGPFEDLQPGQWYEVPNSKIRDHLPDPIPPGSTGPKAIITAWNSGAYDTKRDRLMIWGGGHNDYGGNEIYAFDIASLSWSRIWGPSPDIPPPQTGCDPDVVTYSDGNPMVRHTYDGLDYLPVQDAFWIHGGSRYCGGGAQSSDTWIFDLESGKWQRRADLPSISVLEMVSAYDPVTGHIFVNGPASWLSLWEYDPKSNSWTKRGGGQVLSQMTATFDFKRRLFIAVGRGTVFAYDVSSPVVTRTELTTTGATEIVNAVYPGIEYDPVSDKLVAWKGGQAVYTLDLDTLVWSKHAGTNNVVPGSPPSTGVYNRWRYIPSKNAFITVNSIDQNVFLYRLTTGKGGALPSPVVDEIPPAAMEDLQAQ